MNRKALLFLVGAVALGLLLSGCARLGTIPESGDSFSSQALAPFEFVDGKAKVLIGFRALPGQAEEALVRAHGGEVRFTYRIVPAIAAVLPEPAIEALRRNPNVTVVEPDVTIYAHDFTAELNNTWGVKRIGAGTVHTWGNLGAGVKVAVIDTGIDYTHPELAAVYAGGYDFVNKDSDPMDDHGHGTHVSGTVAAARNGVGVVGVAPQVRLYGLKVLGANGSGNFSNVIAALDWCRANGIQVTNNSYGSSSDPGTLTRQAFDNAYSAGILHVASAGNSGNSAGTGDNVGFPAKYGSVIAVAATTSTDVRASFSSTGPDVELAAPGSSITSTVPGGGYASWSGTSMASPHVAGTAALVWAANPTWSNAQVRQRLVDTADDLGTAGRDTWYGWGLVDADEAAAIVTPPTTGTIVVKKTVVGVAPTTEWAFSGTGAIGGFTLPTGGGTKTFANLDPGSYTITETAKAGYTVTYKVDAGPIQTGTSATVSLSAGQTVTIEFINTAQPATITVTKTVEGTPPADAWSFTGTSPIGTFTLPAAGGTSSPFTVTAGQSYTITETTKPGYAVTYRVDGGAAQSGASATVTPAPGQAITIEFINTYTPPIAMFVADITMALAVVNKNFTTARATITVRDANGNPVSGAAVSGQWSGATSGTATGTTDSTGKVTFTSAQVRNPPRGTTFRFCVANVTKSGYAYDSERNVETCDSISVP